MAFAKHSISCLLPSCLELHTPVVGQMLLCTGMCSTAHCGNVKQLLPPQVTQECDVKHVSYAANSPKKRTHRANSMRLPFFYSVWRLVGHFADQGQFGLDLVRAARAESFLGGNNFSVHTDSFFFSCCSTITNGDFSFFFLPLSAFGRPKIWEKPPRFRTSPQKM